MTTKVFLKHGWDDKPIGEVMTDAEYETLSREDFSSAILAHGNLIFIRRPDGSFFLEDVDACCFEDENEGVAA